MVCHEYSMTFHTSNMFSLSPTVEQINFIDIGKLNYDAEKISYQSSVI